jgi:SAM-dependent methyltransferase
VPHAHAAHAHAADGHPAADHSELLDLDARVLGGYLDELVGWAGELGPADVRTVVDLGAGTGVGSLALARRFPAAEVVAVDRTTGMLHRTSSAAADAGWAGRVRAVHADLDDAWPAEIDRVDLAWASSSLHEVADADRLLRDVWRALRPGGLLAVVEIGSLPRFLPDDVAPGLETRCAAALTEAGWNAHPDWRPHLERAGFDVVAVRHLSLEGTADPATSARYARAWLRHVRRGLDGRLSADDLETLDRLVADTGPGAVLDRADLVVRGGRTAWAARRPAPTADRS